MAEFKVIAVGDLLLDVRNPRFPTVKENQVHAIQGMVEAQGGKILALAEDIQKFGLNPSESFIVVQDSDSGYIVLEGNRRLCAIRLLENPLISINKYSPKNRGILLNLSASYIMKPVDSVFCVVFEDSFSADHWIQLRHQGESGGAGIVKWGAAESSRYGERFGKKEVHMQIIDLLVEKGLISTEQQLKIPVTSFRRIVEQRYIRDTLGYDFHNGFIDQNEFSSLALNVLQIAALELANGEKVTGDIYTKDLRAGYINGIIARLQPGEEEATAAASKDSDATSSAEKSASNNDSTKESNEQADETTSYEKQDDQQANRDSAQAGDSTTANRKSTATEAKGAKSTAASAKTSKDINRNYLPSLGVKLSIEHKRISKIFNELKDLELDKYPNAVSVLFRVFVELSIDAFIIKNSSRFPGKNPADGNYKLHIKMVDVGQDLLNQGKIKEFEMRSVRQVAASDSYQPRTITTMNQHVHNLAVNPVVADLRASWDNLQAFIEAIWR